MAHAQKKSFRSDATHDIQDKSVPQEALANTALAFWSNMAEMQRRYLAAFAGEANEKMSQLSDNVTELRPNAIAAPAAAISQNWMSTAVECQREMASFMSERISKNQNFLSNAVGMHRMQDIVQLQAEWMQQTALDYTNEIGRLTGIVKNGADEAIAVTA